MGMVGVWLVGVCAVAGARQQGEEQRYELRGKVLNAVTGAGVGNALVHMPGPGDGAQFSAADGTFVFTGLPRGSYHVMVRKPGYFTEGGMSYGSGTGSTVVSVPRNGAVVLKLTPEGVIYGRVENENGQGVESLTVRAESWQVVDGVKRLQSAGQGVTDDEGQFRIAELQPGTYYLHFFPSNREGTRVFGELERKPQSTEGYGSQFYPGVSEVASATAIRVRAGAQVHIAQSLRPQKLYEVSGVVRGTNLENGFQVNLSDEFGVLVQMNVHLDPKTGVFQIEGVPEGSYLLMATAEDPQEEEQHQGQLTATMPIHLNRDVTGLSLMLGRGANVRVVLEDEVPVHGDEVHLVRMQLVSKQYPQMSRGLVVPPPKDQPRAPRSFEGVPAGRYEVQAWTWGAGVYVASLRCGDVDLLKDELTVMPGMAPITVRLRNDGGHLLVNVVDHDGQASTGMVLIYSEQYPRRSMVLPAGEEGKTGMRNVPPGTYKVVALHGSQDVEFQDEAFVEKYVTPAKEVELKGGDKVTVQVEVQGREEE
jgi:hypothetical protein